MTMWRRNGFILGLAGLYGGVIVGGMSLTFLEAWLIGLAAMMLYTWLMRPAEHWLDGVKLPLTLIILALLVVALVVAGSGLASMTGPLPPLLGPALALGGVLLSRAVWSAARARDLDAFLTEALAGLNAAEATQEADSRRQGWAEDGPSDADDAGSDPDSDSDSDTRGPEADR